MLEPYHSGLKEMIWEQVNCLADDGNVVMTWTTNTETGFDFATYGENRRMPVDLDGLRLVKFLPINNENSLRIFIVKCPVAFHLL